MHWPLCSVFHTSCAQAAHSLRLLSDCAITSRCKPAATAQKTPSNHLCKSKGSARGQRCSCDSSEQVEARHSPSADLPYSVLAKTTLSHSTTVSGGKSSAITGQASSRTFAAKRLSLLNRPTGPTGPELHLNTTVDGPVGWGPSRSACTGIGSQCRPRSATDFGISKSSYQEQHLQDVSKIPKGSTRQHACATTGMQFRRFAARTSRKSLQQLCESTCKTRCIYLSISCRCIQCKHQNLKCMCILEHILSECIQKDIYSSNVMCEQHTAQPPLHKFLAYSRPRMTRSGISPAWTLWSVECQSSHQARQCLASRAIITAQNSFTALLFFYTGYHQQLQLIMQDRNECLKNCTANQSCYGPHWSQNSSGHVNYAVLT